MSQTILTKFWELLHLLFIGIAVAYGLFSRRHVDVEVEPHLETHSSVDSAPSYVSKMFPDSTIFGEGSENPCGYDEKRVVHFWNPQYFDGGAVGVLDEQYKTQLPVSGGDSLGYSVGFDGNNNVVQAWNSEYYHSEPVVVVAQPYYNTTGECGEVAGYKPLGLPVRSLRSVAREVDGPRYASESDSSSGSTGSSKGSDKSRDREFGELGPSNLENKSNDAAATIGGSASPIPWHSRSRRVERERRHGNVSRPSHFRPLSVDEAKFEAFNSRPLQSTASFNSRTGMYSSLDSISSDNMNFQEEEMRKKEASYMTASEKMDFQEEDMVPKTSYVPAMETMNFEEEDIGQRKTSYVPVSENMNFQEEDMGQRKTYYVPTSENLNFQEADLVKNISQGSSSRNGRMTTKGKYAAVSYPSHFRPMSVDETPFESPGSQSFQSMGSFSSHTSLYSSLGSSSSDNMNFQEEDMEQQKTSHVNVSENVDFKEEVMGQKKTSYVHASEKVNFQEEDMEQQKTPYAPASENMKFQEVDLGKVSEGSSLRTVRMGTKGKRAAVSHPSHFRPMSVDETQFESLSSRSFQSMGSFSSRTSLDSVSSENMNLPKEDLGGKKSSHGSSSSSSPSPPARSDGETSLRPFHARGYSTGSLLQDDMKSNMNDDLRDLNWIGGEDRSDNKKSGMHALQSDSGKPTSLTKASSRGKSVRTRRAGGLTSGTMRTGETSSKQTDEKVEKKPPTNVESALIRKDKVKIEEPDLLLKGISKKKLESYAPKPEVAFSNHHKKDKPEPSKKVFTEDLDIDLEDIQVSSDEDRMSECVNDSGLDSEVDKKASEFIAKFKAQIRLQKSGSIERSKGQKTIGNYIR